MPLNLRNFLSNNVLLGVSRDEIEGASIEHVFSINMDVSTDKSDVNTIFTNVEPLSVAENITITSETLGTNVGVNLFLEGLDDNNDIITETVMLDANGSSTTSEEFIWLNRVTVVGTTGITTRLLISTPTAGDITSIEVEYQRTLMAFMGIPNNYTGYITDASSYINKGKDAVINFLVKTDKDSDYWITVGVANIYQAGIKEDFQFAAIPENSFLKLQTLTSAGGSGVTVSANFNLLLIPNNFGLNTIKNN